MSAHASLFPELEEVVERRSPEHRAETLKRITALFLEDADRFNEDHVRLFDDVLGRLIGNVPSKARAELSARLAPVRNAPVAVVRQLAHDDDISIAGPMLVKSRRLDDSDLADIARSGSDAHLLAIAGRPDISKAVIDILVARGNSEVTRRVVENQSSRLSDLRFASEDDTVEFDAKSTDRDYSTAQQKVDGLRQAGKLDEAALVDFTQQKRQEETVVALASLCAVPIEVVDRLMSSERTDPVLILCKAAGWGWPTVKAIILARNDGIAASSQALDNAYTNFERLSRATAQRVMRFWQVRR